jgi:hypothetical protein
VLSRAGTFPSYVRIVHDRTDRTVFFGYIRPQPEFNEGGGLTARKIRLRCSFPEEGRYTIQVWFFQSEQADILKGEMTFSLINDGDDR